MTRPKLENDKAGIILGNGANMTSLADGEVDLIVTSPPYFPPDVEALLRQPRSDQREVSVVRSRLIEYALSMRPVFLECARVLRRGGKFVVQTKDIRYAGRLLSLASVHRDLAESCGFDLLSRVFWQRTHAPMRHGLRSRAVRRAMTAGGFVAPDVEEFLVFAGTAESLEQTTIEAEADEVNRAMTPLWRLPGPGGRRNHPFASPAAAVRRFVLFYSSRGDLVVDPFAGSGTTLKVARKLGRRAVGYEIDSRFASPAELGGDSH